MADPVSPPAAELAGGPPRFKRVLSRGDLIVYGLVILTPTAAFPVLGLVQQLSHGAAALSYLVAMVAMLLTAASYGKMAAAFPVAGSTYTFAQRALNDHLGFIAGWAMILDYFLIPSLSVIYPVLTLKKLLEGVPYLQAIPQTAWAIFFTAGITLINLRGIRVTARASQVMMVVMGGCAVLFVAMAARVVVARHGLAGLFASHAVFEPAAFSLSALMAGASLAALSYIGFDAITTLAEDTLRPEGDIPFATVLVCVLETIICFATVYLAALVCPEYQFKNGPSAYSEAEIKEVRSFAGKLRNRADPVSAFLVSRFSTNAQDTVAGAGSVVSDEAALRSLLVRELNSILEQGPVFETNRFQGVKLSPQTVALIESHPKEAELVRLNRLLLDETYPADLQRLQKADTVILEIGRRIGGSVLFGLITVVLLVAGLASALTGQAGASRLLFGMGRDGVIPRRFFAYLDPKHSTPTRGIYLMGAVTLLGAVFLQFDEAAGLLNFGAFVGFILVNLSVVAHYYVRLRQRRGLQVLTNLVFPTMAALVCGYVWWNLSGLAMKVGLAWLGLGILYLALLTRGFRRKPKSLGSLSEGG